MDWRQSSGGQYDYANLRSVMAIVPQVNKEDEHHGSSQHQQHSGNRQWRKAAKVHATTQEADNDNGTGSDDGQVPSELLEEELHVRLRKLLVSGRKWKRPAASALGTPVEKVAGRGNLPRPGLNCLRFRAYVLPIKLVFSWVWFCMWKPPCIDFDEPNESCAAGVFDSWKSLAR